MKKQAHTSFEEEWDTRRDCWISSDVLMSVSDETVVLPSASQRIRASLASLFNALCECVRACACFYMCSGVSTASLIIGTCVCSGVLNPFREQSFSHATNKPKRPPATGGVCQLHGTSAWKLDLEGYIQLCVCTLLSIKKWPSSKAFRWTHWFL